MPELLSAAYVDGYRITFVFSDGRTGVIDFKNELEGEIFKPLKGIEYFKSFQFNSISKTIEWPNGADFAPEFLYEKTKAMSV